MAGEKTPPVIGKKFKRVREVREKLRERADEIIDAFLENAKDAQAAQEFEVAANSYKWLIEHLPADDETGEKVVDTSIDKQTKQVDRATGPTLNIGFMLGGLPTPKALPSQQPPKVIVGEVVVEKKDE